MKKKLIGILLCVAMTSTLMAGCGSSSDDSSEETTELEETSDDTTEEATDLDFYFISLMSGGAAWSRAENGFLDACEELGINGQYLAPVERNSATEMAELLDKAVVAKADAIFGVWSSEEMFGPGLTNAKEYGAVTASVQMTLSEDYVDFCIGTDQEGIGEAFGEALIELADGQDVSVIFLCGSASELTNLQYAAFQDVIADEDNITDLGMRFDENSASTANQVISDEARANSDLNAVVCLDSSAATIGVASYVQEQGLEDEWITIGIDSSADILNYVLDEALDATMNQDFYAMGYESVNLAYNKIVNGEEPPFENDTGCYLILPDEVEAYAEENDIDLTGDSE